MDIDTLRLVLYECIIDTFIGPDERRRIVAIYDKTLNAMGCANIMVGKYNRSRVPSVYNLMDVPAVGDRFPEGAKKIQKVFRGVDQMIGFNIIKPGAEATDPHTHPFEQTNLLLEGEIEYVVGDDVATLKPWDILCIPPEVEHGSRIVSDDRAILLAFWPLREDRLSGTEYQEEFNI